ncbi:MAG: hypothetical protein JSU05_03590, partial [Bacteroidetes bacterium]|nr:hypothetical protein [Bacteroidota bacterium]
SSNYIFIKDSSIRIKRFENLQKGTVALSFSFPLITGFVIKPEGKPYRSAGLFGIEAGADYFYRENRYLSLHTGAGTDATFVEYFGTGYIEHAAVLYSNIRNNYVLGSFDLGYGINFSQFIWKRQTLGDTINMDQTIKNNAIGLSLSANYRISNHLRMGMLYQPCFINTGAQRADGYQHYICLKMSWMFPLRKRKQ